MITATITNITQEGTGIRVFWSFSDGTPDQSQLFDISATKADVKAAIKVTLDALNQAASYADSLQALIGTEVQ